MIISFFVPSVEDVISWQKIKFLNKNFSDRSGGYAYNKSVGKKRKNKNKEKEKNSCFTGEFH
jgi:hypothetical protein